MKRLFILFASMTLLAACAGNYGRKVSHSDIALDYKNMSTDDLILLSGIISRYDTLLTYDDDFDQIVEENQSSFIKYLCGELYGINPVPLPDCYFDSGDQALEFSKAWYAFLIKSRNFYEDLNLASMETQLEAYLTAMRRYIHLDQPYPVEKFRSILKSVNMDYAYLYNHGGLALQEMLSLKCMVDAGLYGIRSISDVADMYTDDGRAAIFQIPSGYNYEYCQSLILFESDSAIYANLWKAEGDYPHNYFTKVFHINEQNKDYYLFFDDSSYSLSMRMFVFEESEEAQFREIHFVGENTFGFMLFDLPWFEEHSGQDFKIIYNPREYKWNYCYFDGEYWQQIPDTETLYLIFDGENPKLVTK